MFHTRVSRRGFLGSAGAALGVAALDLRAAPALALSPEGRYSVDRPFHMLAFGDSIMWGQGLAGEQKFASLVRAWVAAQLPERVVTLDNYAHSGAIIQPNAVEDARGVWGGEVPASYPSIVGQVWRALDVLDKTKPFRAYEVDLILLDGGINDVDVLNILIAWDAIGSAPKDAAQTGLATAAQPLLDPVGFVRELTRDRLGTRMAYLLPIVTGAFPNATVVVTGYYRIVTSDSVLSEVVALLLALGMFTGFTTLTLLPLVAPLKARLEAQCAAFHDEANAQLRAAVAAENARTPNRCVYVDPMFADPNGYGASSPWLFKVAESDPAIDARSLQCDAAGQSLNPKCRSASMGHPNVAGAQRYAQQITPKLTQFLPKWRGLRTMRVCIDPSPVLGREATYTVWAIDAETSRPVPGTVELASGPTVATGTPFNYTFQCTAASTERTGARDVSVTPKECNDVAVSAPGYVGATVRVG